MEVRSPYNPLKILRYKETLEKLLESEDIPYPKTMEVDLVDRGCNNKCIFCCFGNNFGLRPIFIDKDKLISALKIARLNGTKAVELVGGSEPTMHPHLKEIIEEIHQMGMELGLITNGLLLDRIREVAQYFTYVRVSLDAGSKDTHKKLHGIDCFKKVIDNIKLLSMGSQKPVTIGLGYLCVAENSNQKEIELFVKKAISLEVNYVVFRPAIVNNCQDHRYLSRVRKIIKKMKKKYGEKVKIYASAKNRWEMTRHNRKNKQGKCFTCALTGVIMADGTIPYCNLGRRNPKMFMGNINTKKYDQIWNSKKHKALFDSFDVSLCPVPCKANDYRKVLLKYKDKMTTSEIIVKDSAHPNFI